ncbi:hypothetical protein MNBD_GAMMA07-1115 [hydrothermal vent metagenome]|uniref:Uncharacterized protein n=1 Tax=hydrothermal vent metagenome TaxID=652676 RepID=A0A3B0WBS0_9ZZZZ
MLKSINKNINLYRLGLPLILLLWHPLVIASDDDYLNELESEVDSVTSLKPNADLTNTTDKARLEKQKKNMVKFEKKLANSLPATYHAYKRLSKDAQANVVSYYYQKDQDMTATTRHLFSLYFSSKNKHQ